MATIIAHTQTLSGFFNKLAHRLYDYRSAKAERELGYRSRAYQEGVIDALAWFRKAGYLA